MTDDERLEINLNEIWRACRKIQATIYRYGFDICADFCIHDPKGTGLISQSLFIDILAKYKSLIGLSDFELNEVTDYFRLRDGRVNYRQFCAVVADEDNQKPAKSDFVHGLNWNDPMHVNPISSPEDRRRLCLLMIKIAQTSFIPLKPYFQDYELVTGNYGVVTIPHFSRILHFLKLPLSENDYMLLLKRYMKDSHLVNYVGFLNHLGNVTDYLRKHGLMNTAGELLKDFPGNVIDLDISFLPVINGTELATNIFKDLCDHSKESTDVCDIISCIQDYVHKNRVRIGQFLECFDLLHTGTITKNQLERALYNIGVGKHLTQKQINKLCKRYVDPIDMNRVKWRDFENEIDQVFTIKNLDKMPEFEVQSPPPHIANKQREGAMDWNSVKTDVRATCEDALAHIQLRIRTRRLYLHPFFRSYDRLNSGHVLCSQFNRVMQNNGILLTPKEVEALLHRYGNKLGFNYTKFLLDADPAEYAIPKVREPSNITAECPTYKKDKQTEEISDETIVKILSNAKRQMILKSIPLLEFLQDYDRHREGEVLVPDFKRSLNNAGVNLPEQEVDILCRIFRSPKRACCVLYRDFVKALNEIFVQIESTTGDNEVITFPLIHLANLDCVDCFLNFEERTLCSKALMKLARKPDEISNLKAVFQDFDKENCGTITQNQFMRALSVREMHHLVSTREYECICKCFGLRRGLELEFKYREFLNTLNVLFNTGQVKRNY